MKKNYVCVENRLEIYDDQAKQVYSARIVCRNGNYVLTKRSNEKFDLYRLESQTAIVVVQWAEAGKCVAGGWELQKYDELYKVSQDGKVTNWGRFSSGHFEVAQEDRKILVRYYDPKQELFSLEALSVLYGCNPQSKYEIRVAFKTAERRYQVFDVAENGSVLRPVQGECIAEDMGGLTMRFIPVEKGDAFRAEVIEIENALAEILPEPKLPFWQQIVPVFARKCS